jgi:hypothetical protein
LSGMGRAFDRGMLGLIFRDSEGAETSISG